MRKLYSLIFSLLLFTGAAFGQTLKGHVYDADNNEPLAGVNITYKKINGDTNGTISDPQNWRAHETVAHADALAESAEGVIPVAAGRRFFSLSLDEAAGSSIFTG